MRTSILNKTKKFLHKSVFDENELRFIDKFRTKLFGQILNKDFISIKVFLNLNVKYKDK